MRPEKWQRNALIEAVEKGGLDKRECTFDFGDSESRITHVPSGSSFLLQGSAGNYNSTIVVGEGGHRPLQHYTWPTVEDRIESWAREVKRDVETPDRTARPSSSRPSQSSAWRPDGMSRDSTRRRTMRPRVS